MNKSEDERASANATLTEAQKTREDRATDLVRAEEAEASEAAPSRKSVSTVGQTHPHQSVARPFRLTKTDHDRLDPLVLRIHEAREAADTAAHAQTRAREDARQAIDSGDEARREDANRRLNAAEGERAERERQVQAAVNELTTEIGQVTDRRAFLTRLVLLGALLAAGELAMVLFPGKTLNLGQIAVLILVSVATSAFAVVVYQMTGRFAWFGVAAFLAIGVFQGFATHFSITAKPQVEPAAVLWRRAAGKRACFLLRPTTGSTSVFARASTTKLPSWRSTASASGDWPLARSRIAIRLLPRRIGSSGCFVPKC